MISGKAEAQRFRERLVKDNLDLLILHEVSGEGQVDGYGVMSHVHRKYGILISSGNVYGALYKLERRGFLEGKWAERKRTYAITAKGTEFLSVVSNSRDLDLKKLLF